MRPERRHRRGAATGGSAATASGGAPVRRERPGGRRASPGPVRPGSGDVSTSTFTASWTSVDALRNSRMLLPSDGADLGQLAGAEDRGARSPG